MVSGDGAGLSNDTCSAAAVRADVGPPGTDTRIIFDLLWVPEGEEAREMTVRTPSLALCPHPAPYILYFMRTS